MIVDFTLVSLYWDSGKEFAGKGMKISTDRFLNQYPYDKRLDQRIAFLKENLNQVGLAYIFENGYSQFVIETEIIEELGYDID